MQALSLAIQHHQSSQRFDGSLSRRIGSTSSRRRNNPISDPTLTNPKQQKQVTSFISFCFFSLVGLLCLFNMFNFSEKA